MHETRWHTRGDSLGQTQALGARPGELGRRERHRHPRDARAVATIVPVGLLIADLGQCPIVTFQCS
jgi:hypothetical protein